MTSFQAWQKPCSKSTSDRDTQKWGVKSGTHETHEQRKRSIKHVRAHIHKVAASIGLAFWFTNATKYKLLFNMRYCWAPQPNILGKQFYQISP